MQLIAESLKHDRCRKNGRTKLLKKAHNIKSFRTTFFYLNPIFSGFNFSILLK